MRSVPKRSTSPESNHVTARLPSRHRYEPLPQCHIAFQRTLGIDTGGTFTDFILASTGEGIRLYKTPSTPHDPPIAVREGLEQIGADLKKLSRLAYERKAWL